MRSRADLTLRPGRHGLPRKTWTLLLAAFAAGCWRPALCPFRSVMPAGEYWSHVLLGNLGQDGSTGEYLCFWVQGEEQRNYYRISKQVLADRKAKEEAFRNRVAGIIAFLERPHGRDAFPWLSKELTAASGLTIHSAEEWSGWWHLNKDRLRLSPDGEVLQAGR